jgi:hypothetical protein
MSEAVRRTAAIELAKAQRSADGCPYLERWLAHYQDQPAAHLERAIRRYAPATLGATKAIDYLPPLSAKLAEGIARWVKTGEVPSAPEAGGEGGDDGAAPSGGALMPKGIGGGAVAQPDVASIAARLGDGQPLPASVRASMEGALAVDLAHVRVHTDGGAAQLSRDLDARAVTIGRHVAFGADEFRPGDPRGDALLAHELAHVAQQDGGTAGAGATDASPTLEAEADDAAAAAVARLHGTERDVARAPSRRPDRGRGLRLQRCGPSYHPRTAADLERQLPIVIDLRRRFGVGVREDGANWDADLLQRVADALALLKGPELAAVSGITFVRVPDTGIKGGGLDADAAHKLEVSQPDKTKAPTFIKEILIADSAINMRTDRLVSLIVHELGHAIEESARVQARFEIFNSEFEYSQAIAATNRTHNPFAKAMTDFGQVSFPIADFRAAKAFFAANNAALDAYVALRKLNTLPDDTDVVKQQGPLDAALTAALAQLDAEWQNLNTSAPGNAVIAAYQPVKPLFDAAVADSRAVIQARVHRANAAATDKKVTGKIAGQEASARLIAFKAIVDKEGYQQLSWPGDQDPYTARVRREESAKPWRFYEEMFAEAFSMWKTDKQRLHDQAPELEKFFERQDHLK